MSKRYLTKAETYTKLGVAGTPSNPNYFTLKWDLLTLGCEQSLLVPYGSNEYVVDDDISLPLVYGRVAYKPAGSYSGDTSLNSVTPFSFDKSWEVALDFTVTSVQYGFVNILQIYGDSTGTYMDYLDIRKGIWVEQCLRDTLCKHKSKRCQ